MCMVEKKRHVGRRKKSWLCNISGSAVIVALQETWLMSHELTFLGSIDEEFACIGVSDIEAMDSTVRLLRQAIQLSR